MSIRNRASRPGSATSSSTMAARSASPAAPAKCSTSERQRMTRFQERYDTVVRPALMQEFGYTNPMQVPRVDKIVVNMGVGDAVRGMDIVIVTTAKTDAEAKALLTGFEMPFAN